MNQRTGLETTDVLSTRQAIALLERHLSRNVDIKQMDLSMNSDELSLRVVHRAGVVDRVCCLINLRDRTCMPEQNQFS